MTGRRLTTNFGIALGTLTVLLFAVSGYAPSLALRALWLGSFGSWYSLTSGTLVRAIPLLLTGTGVAIAFRAGVLNIGAEGQLLMGAAAASAAALVVPAGGVMTIIAALLLGGLAGAAWSGAASVLRVRFGVLEVISTILLNFVALFFVSWLVRGPLQEPTHAYPQTVAIADGVHLARIGGMGRLHFGIVLALAVALYAGWSMRHSAAGFRLLAVGENADAAASAGMIDVRRVTILAFLVSGALAGVAGACEVLGVTFALYENISPGYGYTAIAVALLARLDPWFVIPSALLFAGLESGAGAMQRDAGVPASVVTVIEALLILTVLVAQARRARVAPALAAA